MEGGHGEGQIVNENYYSPYSFLDLQSLNYHGEKLVGISPKVSLTAAAGLTCNQSRLVNCVSLHALDCWNSGLVYTRLACCQHQHYKKEKLSVTLNYLQK
jgi:hypothetical protein